MTRTIAAVLAAHAFISIQTAQAAVTEGAPFAPASKHASAYHPDDRYALRGPTTKAAKSCVSAQWCRQALRDATIAARDATRNAGKAVRYQKARQALDKLADSLQNLLDEIDRLIERAKLEALLQRIEQLLEDAAREGREVGPEVRREIEAIKIGLRKL